MGLYQVRVSTLCLFVRLNHPISAIAHSLPSLLAADEGVRWPDTPAIQPGGDLIFTSSSLNEHFAGTVKRGEERYELWRLPLSGRVAKAG